MVRNRLRARLPGRPGDSPLYPVVLVVSATANRDRGSARRRFFHRRIEVGLQDLGKLVMAKAVTPSAASPVVAAVVPRHVDEDFAVVSVGVGMKFPDVFPKDYAMCEVRLDVSFVARRGEELAAAKDMYARIGPHVQQTLGDIARAAGGVAPFVDNPAAAQGAEVPGA